MVFSRKRKEPKSPNFLLDDSPKRTKVQAQRKFAQGSNVNSPVLTPVRDLELQEKTIPEPIELLPTKRPNTEDFLTFLCFRGTSVLPPTLNYFNSASSISDSRQQTESPATSPKNGIILPSTISKTQGERPFIAFGVRKRADPIVVSRHMDRKRRHALALQALRRKYQEQKMAKIRAITISKLSEKVQTNKTVVRTTRSLTNTNTITKKKIPQKTKVTVVASKVTTQRTSIKPPIRSSGVKAKMCLRSYRGRFVQRELINKPAKKRQITKAEISDETMKDDLEFSSEDDEPLSTKVQVEENESEAPIKKVQKEEKKNNNLRVTRSNILKSKLKTSVRAPRLLARIQNKLISPPNSPQLRTRLKRKITIVRNKQVTIPVSKKRVVIKKVALKKNIVKQNIVTQSMSLRKRQDQSVRNSKSLVTRSVNTRDNNSNSNNRRLTRESVRKVTGLGGKLANVKKSKVEVITKRVEGKVEAVKEAKKLVEKRVTREDVKKIEENKNNPKATVPKKQFGNKKLDEKKVELPKKIEMNKNNSEVEKKSEIIKAEFDNTKKVEISKKIVEGGKTMDLSKKVSEVDKKIELSCKSVEADKIIESMKKNMELHKKTVLNKNVKKEGQSKKLEDVDKKKLEILRSGEIKKHQDKKTSLIKKVDCINVIDDLTNKTGEKTNDGNKKTIDKKPGLNKKDGVYSRKVETSEIIKNKVLVLELKDSVNVQLAKNDSDFCNENVDVEKKHVLKDEIVVPVPMGRKSIDDYKKILEDKIKAKLQIIKPLNKDVLVTEAQEKVVINKKNAKIVKSIEKINNIELDKGKVSPQQKVLVSKEVTEDLKKEVQATKKMEKPELKPNNKKSILLKYNKHEINLVTTNKPASIMAPLKQISIINLKDERDEVNSTCTIIERIDVAKPKTNNEIDVPQKPIKCDELEKINDQLPSKKVQIDPKDLRRSNSAPEAKPSVVELPIIPTIIPTKDPLSLPILIEKARRSSLELKLATDNTKLALDNNKLQADNTKLLFDNNKLIADNNKLVLDNNKLLTDNNKLILNKVMKKANNPKVVTNSEEIINNSNLIRNKLFTEVKQLACNDKKNNSNQPEKAESIEIKQVLQKDKKTNPKILTKVETVKKDETEVKISSRPSRKTKEAAAIYMEILGHKLVSNDIDDDVSIDSFPELPNARRTEQRENELKAKAKQKLENSPKSKIPKTPEKKNKKYTQETDDSDESFTAEITIIPEKRSTRIKSPKLYKSFSDTDSEPEMIPIKTTKRKSASSIQNSKKVKSCENFNDSDEEPLVKFKKVKEETPKPKEIIGKQKRECAKRPQNYLTEFSSSDEDEKYFHGFVKNDPPPKAKPEIESKIDSLYTKSVARRYGKERVNMSNEQIEKWLNDSALAGFNLIKKENDEMLKFGEKIPSENIYDEIKNESPEKKESCIDIIALEKFQNKTFISNEKKTIFRKEKVELSRNINAFSVCNESSVYAFEADNEDSVSTPFRRPSRRPSSTTTSKSEDDPELKAVGKFRHPNIIRSDIPKPKPETPPETPIIIPKQEPSSMFPPSNTTLQKNKSDTRLNRARCSRSFDRFSEGSEDTKYKIPSSPSASSSSSSKLYKKTNAQKKKLDFYNPVNTSEFPSLQSDPKIVEAPIYRPNEKEFIDPLEYIEKIRNNAEKFGICRIVPPPNFKPECKVLDEMRFTAYNQYVHKMMDRWGPNFREFVAIRKYLLTQNITLKHPPWIGGMEIDLPRLYQTVQTLGGLKEVIEKKKWTKVSELMRIPKSAQDRVTKLDDIYCKYLLPYDTLSPEERDKLFDSVETEWAKRESKNLLKAQANDSKKIEEEEESDEDDESDMECIVKGRSIALSAFYRIARNTMAMWFKNTEPTAQEVEEEFWKHVIEKQHHICVHSGSIDSGNWGYGFAVSKNSPFARHAWNLKVLTNNSGSILRSMGPVMGLTVPTLHVGMVFSSCCWYRDPHSLPWIEYLHTGANKIWYSIPDSMGEKFHSTLSKLVPNYCLNKSIWLPSDTAMLPPNLLVDNGISVTKTVQEPGEFVVIFPKAFTSNICTGYTVSESVFFSPPHWLNSAQTVFEELRNSCEPSMFSYERLLLNIASDPRSDVNVLNHIIPAVRRLSERETLERGKLKTLGVTQEEKLSMPEVKKKKKMNETETEYACEDCRWNLYCSMVWETQENAIYCLDHAIQHLEKQKIEAVNCKLMFTYDSSEVVNLVDKLKATIEAKIQKKANSKFSGMATLLNR